MTTPKTDGVQITTNTEPGNFGNLGAGVTNPNGMEKSSPTMDLIGAREVLTVARALELARDLADMGYPGAGDVVTWLDELQTAITPSMPSP